MKIFLKNLFTYKWNISRAWFLLFLIWFFLTIISFIKGIQILIFIPAFVVSLFLYALFEYFFRFKKVKFQISIGKNGNILKIFSPQNTKYNFILAQKDINGKIHFLTPSKDLNYILEENKEYELYLYIFWAFDIIRKVFFIGKYDFAKEQKNETYFTSKVYESGDSLKRIDILKSSFSDIPYIKIEENSLFTQKNKSLLHIVSNNYLEVRWEQNITFLHILLILLWVIWLAIEWENIVFNIIIFSSIFFTLIAKYKKIVLSETSQKWLAFFAFIFMLILSIFHWEMSGSGSMFLIQLLLLVTLTKNGWRNSFLFIFLILFVFVAISLFSSQIRFILLFLVYLFISTYLLFFISWDETFHFSYYKFWNKVSGWYLGKIFFTIVVSILFFYFILPHWENKNVEWQNKESSEIISGFNEEITFEDIGKISTDNSKIFVIENITPKMITDIWLKYFRGMRLETFNGIKWEAKYKNSYIPVQSEDFLPKDTISLKFHYYGNGGKNIFIPNTPVWMQTSSHYKFFHPLHDNTILKTSENRNENIVVNMNFLKNNDGKIRDNIKETYDFEIILNESVKEMFSEFIKNIPENIQSSPKALSDYIQTKAGFEYSIEDPASNFEDFLYGSKKGHCEYFATTLAVVLQHFWYKATVVNGFSSWEYNALANSFIIRWKNAHSWVELYNVETNSWDIFDPTPTSSFWLINTFQDIYQYAVKFYDYIDIKWYTYIASYTSEEQRKLFLYIYNQKGNIFFGFICLCFLVLFLKILKNIFNFFTLNKKEKIMFFFWKYFKTDHFALQKIKPIQKEMYDKYNIYIYSQDTKDISYKDFFSDLKFLYKKK